MIIAGRILAILFVIANSGFTTVLRECTMKSDAPMECCSLPQNTNSDCGDAVQSDAHSLPILSQFSCHTTTIVGGIVSIDALLQRELSIQKSIANASFNHLQPSTFFKSYTPHLEILFYFPSTISPPQVEKCLLNSTLLI